MMTPEEQAARERSKAMHPSNGRSPLPRVEPPQSGSSGPRGTERTDGRTDTPRTDDCGGGEKPPPGRNVAHGDSGEGPEDSPGEAGLVRWVCKLSCGHDLGSRGRVSLRAVPAAGAVLACRVCREDAKVVDVVDTRPLDLEG